MGTGASKIKKTKAKKTKKEKKKKEEPALIYSRVQQESNPRDDAFKAEDTPPESRWTIYSHKKSDAIFVAAIDFGTTNTGFSFNTKYEQDKAYGYVTVKMGGQFDKCPTVVLLQPDKQFHSFGTEAVYMYLQLVKQNKHHQWYYFERFKMKLHARQEPLTKDIEIDDILGNTMLAMDVFVAAISSIRKRLLDYLNRISLDLDTDVHWVLTVPAIWDDLSKQFMRVAAQKAGIPCDKLTLALEPEAASLFCRKYLQINEGNTRRYMLLDLGGGTVDITCHEVNSKGVLKELHPPTGGAFGGTAVDNEFLSVLNRLFGSDVMLVFKKSYMQEYLELMAAFERKKFNFDGIGEVKIEIPFDLLTLYNTYVGEPVEKSLIQSTLVRNVEITKQRHMILSETLMKDIFNTAVLKIKDAD